MTNTKVSTQQLQKSDKEAQEVKAVLTKFFKKSSSQVSDTLKRVENKYPLLFKQ